MEKGFPNLVSGCHSLLGRAEAAHPDLTTAAFFFFLAFSFKALFDWNHILGLGI